MSKRVIGKHPKIAKQSNQGDINLLPDSEILTLYEQHTKGTTDRFLTLIEQQQKYRHEMGNRNSGGFGLELLDDAHYLP
ncbi:hypothetical protein B5C26_18540 [Photorhabdus luminescens]|uniref:DUF2335 domain-containing protein n=1 Tax=Photorhabdus luminescens TaxID=29488 RepID=UPI000B6DC8F8|nr:DUF2335 domain-containing protein [Photorhabdus luminescens]OWO80154.1 hypothetical protein B5C26_18540 [Photorhabdus luminescens]